MLAIIIIAFQYYKLAEKYDQNKWLYGFVGIAIYFLSAFILGIILGAIDLLFHLNINFENSSYMELTGLISGIIVCVIFYYVLEKKWKNTIKKSVNEIDEIGKKRIED